MQKKAFTDDCIARLARYGIHDIPTDVRHLSFDAGEAICREGMPIPFFCVVISGRAKVCLTTLSGKNLVLCYYVSDGVIGDIELATDSYTATATVIAITDFECITIPYGRNARLLKNNITFMNQISKGLAGKLLLSSSNFLSAALYSGEQRLCSYILQSAQNEIFHDILADVACSVGLSYRHLFRILNHLCVEGVLQKGEFGYRIVNREELCRKAIHANR